MSKKNAGKGGRAGNNLYNKKTEEKMMERKTGSSDFITRAYLDSLLLEVRHLDSVLPDTSMDLFGAHFDTPVMTAALSHLHRTWEMAWWKWRGVPPR